MLLLSRSSKRPLCNLEEKDDHVVMTNSSVVMVVVKMNNHNILNLMFKQKSIDFALKS